MKLWFKALFLILLTTDIVFAEPLFSPENRLSSEQEFPQLASRQPVLAGHFEQIRHVAQMDVAIRSEGEFLIDQQMGLLWEQTMPFLSRLWMNQQRIVQQNGSASPVEISSSENPLPFTIGRIFFALFRGEFDELRTAFEPYLLRSEQHWQLGLRPTDALIAKVIQQIEVDGDRQIRSLKITDSQGNVQEFIFGAIVAASELSLEQRERLQP
ncbi:outer membrane lipoprotein carrier protein LolA [Corallincola platygyrae]|uniref:Outer membrane lipoprotein carrier protein LolA n=1 Tax=Corallincola platygyrae TaxID=1193278 RepID=A0ABW4XIM4_9GAMM